MSGGRASASLPGPPLAPLCEAEGLSFGYRMGGRVRWILDRVSFRLERGGFHLLAGSSGSGKSSLLHLLAGELEPEDPAWVVRGALRWNPRRPRIVTLFQREGLFDDLGVRGNLRLVVPEERKVEELLENVGLAGCPDEIPHLSGGQRKRLALARTLALEPDLLLLDEPTAGLDPETTRRILEVLKRIHRDAGGRLAVLLCSHDLEACRKLADRVLLLDGGGGLACPAIEEWDGRIPVRDPVPGGRGAFPGFGPAFLLEIGSWASSLVRVLTALPPERPLACLARGWGVLSSLLPFLALSGFGFGALTIYFVALGDPMHGAMKSELDAVTGRILLVILLPFLVSLLYAAPAVSSILAGIGAMRRDRQFAAHRALGRSIRAEILSPILWSHLLALPLIFGAAFVATTFGAFTVEAWRRGVGFSDFVPVLLREIGTADLLWCLGKSLGGAVLVVWIPWRLANRPGQTPKALGESARSAWILTALSILLLQGLCLFPQLLD